jgi:hypothetical protein
MCEFIPIRLILATSDPEVFSKNSYGWSGDIYVKIECEDSKSQFQSMTASPFSWSFCNSSGCARYTNRLNVIFSFNPVSTDPKDQLKFVIDTAGYILARPENAIYDSDGKNINLDIESVTRHGSDENSDSILELWLSKGSAKGTFLPHLIIAPNTSSTINWSYIVTLLGILVGILIVLALGYYGWQKYKGGFNFNFKTSSVSQVATKIAEIPVTVQAPQKQIVPHMVL